MPASTGLHYTSNNYNILSSTSTTMVSYQISSKRCEICNEVDHNTDDHVFLCIHCGEECTEDEHECDECLGLDNGGPSSGGWEDTPFSPPS